MIRKYLMPMAGAFMMAFAIYHVVRAQQSPPELLPPASPARTPFKESLAAAGVVEAQTENIAIGSHLPGIVTAVLVRVGQKMEAGKPLFRLDDRHLQADLRVREANLASARTQLARLESLPRPEELPPSEAKLRETQANVADQEDMYQRVKMLRSSAAVGEEELLRRRQALQMAREQAAKARADHALLRSGAWDPDRAVARAAVALAQAQIDQVRTDLERLVVCAPVDGEVLQVNVRPGESVASAPGHALVVLGNVGTLHLRVDVDEHDIPRLDQQAGGQATVRGDGRGEFGLKFVRIEPFVVPKKSLTGAGNERVDTRVLQVLYALDTSGRTLYVGQQMDVFLPARAKKSIEAPVAPESPSAGQLEAVRK